MRKFKSWLGGNLGPDYLKQSARAEKMFQTLGDQQKDHGILVVAAQFGFRHRGRSVRRARELMQLNEFCLCAFAVGIMLLTHPERLMHVEDLSVDCAGDEYALDVVDDFSDAPTFFFDHGQIMFEAHWFGDAYGNFGSASAFLV